MVVTVVPTATIMYGDTERHTSDVGLTDEANFAVGDGVWLMTFAVGDNDRARAIEVALHSFTPTGMALAVLG